MSCVEVIVFEEVSVAFDAEIAPVLAKAIADLCYYEAFSYGGNGLFERLGAVGALMQGFVPESEQWLRHLEEVSI